MPAVMAAASPETWKLGMRRVKSSLGSTAGGSAVRVPVAGEGGGVDICGGRGGAVAGGAVGWGAGVVVGVEEGVVVLVRGGAVWLAGGVVAFAGGAVEFAGGTVSFLAGGGGVAFVVGGGVVWLVGGVVALPDGGAVVFVGGAVVLWGTVEFAGCAVEVAVSALESGRGLAWARWAPRRVTSSRTVRRIRRTRMDAPGCA
ncbi:MAG: hypothetical protein QOI63_1012 [Thermoplasmata archaeon]|nr:hypothetical protein [Thermoplasmata archaeon]